MAVEKINIERFLALAKVHPVIDVRSPGEYNHAHIPGAFNLPLFTDEERKVVGTAYKQEGREKAIKIGLDYFGPKMNKMIEDVQSAILNQQSAKSNRQNAKPDDAQLPIADCILLYCWRGGMRSAGVAWLLDLYGCKVYTLLGGYKKFRNHVLGTFKSPFQFNILGGYTGSGKTEVLKKLREDGAFVVDLEAIANHKGSAFGNIGLPPQPSQEMFENLLYHELRALSDQSNTEISITPFRGLGGIWLEDESQRIGLVNIPNDIWNQMRQSALYFLEIPFEERLKYIISEYGSLDREKMTDAIKRIREKLGGLNAKNAIEFLQWGDIEGCFRILLAYYDKYYLKALHNRESLDALLYRIDCKSVTPENARKLVRQTQYLRKATMPSTLESPIGPQKP
ncbi:MAG TPA: tRNA 2-selenouridine(34) synthase MnmH [Chitinophagaceae bacterium]|nr:tRNA 2-selenouridine(34) synthase MnmH [Chitinophagaceae bacterium]